MFTRKSTMGTEKELVPGRGERICSERALKTIAFALHVVYNGLGAFSKGVGFLLLFTLTYCANVSTTIG